MAGQDEDKAEAQNKLKREGWLMKRSKHFHAWKTRWATLWEGEGSKDAFDTASELRGTNISESFLLVCMRDARPVETKHFGRPHCLVFDYFEKGVEAESSSSFILRTPRAMKSREIGLQAKDDAERDAWVQVLRQACQNFQRRTAAIASLRDGVVEVPKEIPLDMQTRLRSTSEADEAAGAAGSVSTPRAVAGGKGVKGPPMPQLQCESIGEPAKGQPSSSSSTKGSSKGPAPPPPAAKGKGPGKAPVKGPGKGAGKATSKATGSPSRGGSRSPRSEESPRSPKRIGVPKLPLGKRIGLKDAGEIVSARDRAGSGDGRMTIFDNLFEERQKKVREDIEVLQNVFKTMPRQSQGTERKMSFELRREERSVLTPGQAQNWAIVARTLPLQGAELAEAVESLIPGPLEMDNLDRLANALPGSEQLKQILALGDPEDTIRIVERQLLPIARIIRLEQHLRVLSIGARLNWQQERFNIQMQVLQKACGQLRSSEILRVVLGAVLVMFNYVNFGNVGRNIYRAFDIKSLLQLNGFKTLQGPFPAFSGMHFVALRLLAEKSDLTVDTLSAELQQLHEASEVSLEASQSLIDSLHSEAEFLRNEARTHPTAYGGQLRRKEAARPSAQTQESPGVNFQGGGAISSTAEAHLHTPNFGEAALEVPSSNSQDGMAVGVRSATGFNLFRRVRGWVRQKAGPQGNIKLGDKPLVPAAPPKGAPPGAWLMLGDPDRAADLALNPSCFKKVWVEIKAPGILCYISEEEALRMRSQAELRYAVFAGAEVEPFVSKMASYEARQAAEERPTGFELQNVIMQGNVHTNPASTRLWLDADTPREARHWERCLKALSVAPGAGFLWVHSHIAMGSASYWRWRWVVLHAVEDEPSGKQTRVLVWYRTPGEFLRGEPSVGGIKLGSKIEVCTFKQSRPNDALRSPFGFEVINYEEVKEVTETMPSTPRGAQATEAAGAMPQTPRGRRRGQVQAVTAEGASQKLKPRRGEIQGVNAPVQKATSSTTTFLSANTEKELQRWVEILQSDRVGGLPEELVIPEEGCSPLQSADNIFDFIGGSWAAAARTAEAESEPKPTASADAADQQKVSETQPSAPQIGASGVPKLRLPSASGGVEDAPGEPRASTPRKSARGQFTDDDEAEPAGDLMASPRWKRRHKRNSNPNLMSGSGAGVNVGDFADSSCSDSSGSSSSSDSDDAQKLPIHRLRNLTRRLKATTRQLTSSLGTTTAECRQVLAYFGQGARDNTPVQLNKQVQEFFVTTDQFWTMLRTSFIEVQKHRQICARKGLPDPVMMAKTAQQSLTSSFQWANKQATPRNPATPRSGAAPKRRTSNGAEPAGFSWQQKVQAKKTAKIVIMDSVRKGIVHLYARGAVELALFRGLLRTEGVRHPVLDLDVALPHSIHAQEPAQSQASEETPTASPVSARLRQQGAIARRISASALRGGNASYGVGNPSQVSLFDFDEPQPTPRSSLTPQTTPRGSRRPTAAEVQDLFHEEDEGDKKSQPPSSTDARAAPGSPHIIPLAASGSPSLDMRPVPGSPSILRQTAPGSADARAAPGSPRRIFLQAASGSPNLDIRTPPDSQRFVQQTTPGSLGTQQPHEVRQSAPVAASAKDVAKLRPALHLPLSTLVQQDSCDIPQQAEESDDSSSCVSSDEEALERAVAEANARKASEAKAAAELFAQRIAKEKAAAAQACARNAEEEEAVAEATATQVAEKQAIVAAAAAAGKAAAAKAAAEAATRKIAEEEAAAAEAAARKAAAESSARKIAEEEAAAAEAAARKAAAEAAARKIAEQEAAAAEAAARTVAEEEAAAAAAAKKAAEAKAAAEATARKAAEEAAAAEMTARKAAEEAAAAEAIARRNAEKEAASAAAAAKAAEEKSIAEDIGFDRSAQSATQYMILEGIRPQKGSPVRVPASGRYAQVIVDDGSELPFKLQYSDGDVPATDWLREDAVQLLGEAPQEQIKPAEDAPEGEAKPPAEAPEEEAKAEEAPEEQARSVEMSGESAEEEPPREEATVTQEAPREEAKPAAEVAKPADEASKAEAKPAEEAAQAAEQTPQEEGNSAEQLAKPAEEASKDEVKLAEEAAQPAEETPQEEGNAAEETSKEGAKTAEEAPEEEIEPAEEAPAEEAKPVKASTKFVGEGSDEVSKTVEQVPGENAKSVEEVLRENTKPVEEVPKEKPRPVQKVPREASKPAEEAPEEKAQPAEEALKEEAKAADSRKQEAKLPQEAKEEATPAIEAPKEDGKPFEEVPHEEAKAAMEAPKEKVKPAEDAPRQQTKPAARREDEKKCEEAENRTIAEATAESAPRKSLYAMASMDRRGDQATMCSPRYQKKGNAYATASMHRRGDPRVVFQINDDLATFGSPNRVQGSSQPESSRPSIDSPGELLQKAAVQAATQETRVNRWTRKTQTAKTDTAESSKVPVGHGRELIWDSTTQKYVEEWRSSGNESTVLGARLPSQTETTDHDTEVHSQELTWDSATQNYVDEPRSFGNGDTVQVSHDTGVASRTEATDHNAKSTMLHYAERSRSYSFEGMTAHSHDTRSTGETKHAIDDSAVQSRELIWDSTVQRYVQVPKSSGNGGTTSNAKNTSWASKPEDDKQLLKCPSFADGDFFTDRQFSHLHQGTPPDTSPQSTPPDTSPQETPTPTSPWDTQVSSPADTDEEPVNELTQVFGSDWTAQRFSMSIPRPPVSQSHPARRHRHSEKSLAEIAKLGAVTEMLKRFDSSAASSRSTSPRTKGNSSGNAAEPRDSPRSRNVASRVSSQSKDASSSRLKVRERAHTIAADSSDVQFPARTADFGVPHFDAGDRARTTAPLFSANIFSAAVDQLRSVEEKKRSSLKNVFDSDWTNPEALPEEHPEALPKEHADAALQTQAKPARCRNTVEDKEVGKPIDENPKTENKASASADGGAPRVRARSPVFSSAPEDASNSVSHPTEHACNAASGSAADLQSAKDSQLNVRDRARTFASDSPGSIFSAAVDELRSVEERERSSLTNVFDSDWTTPKDMSQQDDALQSNTKPSRPSKWDEALDEWRKAGTEATASLRGGTPKRNSDTSHEALTRGSASKAMGKPRVRELAAQFSPTRRRALASRSFNADSSGAESLAQSEDATVSQFKPRERAVIAASDSSAAASVIYQPRPEGETKRSSLKGVFNSDCNDAKGTPQQNSDVMRLARSRVDTADCISPKSAPQENADAAAQMRAKLARRRNAVEEEEMEKAKAALSPNKSPQPGSPVRVKASRRSGRILLVDGSELPFKIGFNDGLKPTTDWFKADAVDVLEDGDSNAGV